MHVHTGEIVRNDGEISNRDVKFTRYLSEPFPRAGDTRPRGEPCRGLGAGRVGDEREKSAQKSNAGEPGVIYIA